MSVWDTLDGASAVASLKAQVGGREVSHAWLLLGPRGAGKRAAALAMAAALNCEIEPGVGCGVCSTCDRILRRRHPDVHHIVPEGPLIPVDVIRETVIPEAARSPFEGSRKVFVIEEAERMNPPAQNSLLKTLEEPQPDTVFILISDDDEELLDTVRSRCRVVRLEALSADRIVEGLRRAGVSEDTARLAARLSDGDVERARALSIDPEVSARRTLWMDLPRRLLAPVDVLDAAAEIIGEARAAVKAKEDLQKEEVVALAEAMGEGRGTAAARNALAKRHRRELRRLEEEVLGEALAALASFYRDVVCVRSGALDAVANVDRSDELRAWAASTVSDGEYLAATERLIEARASLSLNANVPLAIESALLEAGRLAPPPEAAHSRP